MPRKFADIVPTNESMEMDAGGASATLSEGVSNETAIAEAESKSNEPGTPFDDYVDESKIQIDLDDENKTHDLVFAIDDADDAVNDLQALDGYVQETEEKGGMDETTAKIVQLTHENIMKRLGSKNAHEMGMRNPVPSFENYKDKKDRKYATLETRKDIQYNIESIISKIGTMLKNAVESAVGFFKKLIDSAKKIHDHAQELSKKLQEKGTEPNKPDFEFKETGIGNKNDALTASSILASVSASMDCISKVLNDLKGAKFDDAWVDKIIVSLNSGLNYLAAAHPAGSMLYGLYSNQRAVLFDQKKSTAEVVQYSKNSITTSKAPDASQIKKLLDSVENQAGWFKDSQSTVKQVSDVMLEMAAVGSVSSTARYFIFLIHVFFEVFPKLLVTSMRDVVDYCAKSINNLQAKA